MKREMLFKLPPEALRALARRKGYPKDASQANDDVVRWLVDRYVEDISRTARERGASIVDLAHSSMGKIRRKLPLSMRGPAAPDLSGTGAVRGGSEDASGPQGHAEDVPSLPADPALRTMTLARVYEDQGMVEQALAVYRELFEREPGNEEARQSIRRLGGDGRDNPPPFDQAGPAVGADAYKPASLPSPVPELPLDALDLFELPGTHGVDEAVLVMVTPGALYACWEVTAATLANARDVLSDPEARLELRIQRIGMGASGASTEVKACVPVPDPAGEHFFKGMAPDSTYVAELFVRSVRAADRFVPVLRSNVTATPRAGSSDRIDELWMHVDQRPLDQRSSSIVPPAITSVSGIGAKDMAMLRLRQLGPEEYSRLTGLPPGSLASLVGSVPAVPDVDPCDLPSSGELSSSGSMR